MVAEVMGQGGQVVRMEVVEVVKVVVGLGVGAEEGMDWDINLMRAAWNSMGRVGKSGYSFRRVSIIMERKWDKTGEIFEKHPCIYTQRGQV